jgi:hypothetical protein
MPFFYTGCESRPALGTTEAMETSTDNSPSDSMNIVDTSYTESITIDSTILDSGNSKSQENTKSMDDETLSRQLSIRARFFKMLLEPEEYRYTGLGAVVNTLPYIAYYSIFNAFVLIFSSLLIKLFKPIINLSLLTIEVLGFLFLFMSQFWDWNNEILYGYWITLSLIFLIILIDMVLFYQNRKTLKVSN